MGVLLGLLSVGPFRVVGVKVALLAVEVPVLRAELYSPVAPFYYSDKRVAWRAWQYSTRGAAVSARWGVVARDPVFYRLRRGRECVATVLRQKRLLGARLAEACLAGADDGRLLSWPYVMEAPGFLADRPVETLRFARRAD